MRDRRPIDDVQKRERAAVDGEDAGVQRLAPGQGDFVRRKHWVAECLQEVYAAMPPAMRMMIEYKLFEPGFYHTDIADWGMAFVFCQKLGDRALIGVGTVLDADTARAAIAAVWGRRTPQHAGPPVSVDLPQRQ